VPQKVDIVAIEICAMNWTRNRKNHETFSYLIGPGASESATCPAWAICSLGLATANRPFVRNGCDDSQRFNGHLGVKTRHRGDVLAWMIKHRTWFEQMNGGELGVAYNGAR
jgi:hypothetical protein